MFKDLTMEQLTDLITAYEKIFDINEKIHLNEEKIKNLSCSIDEACGEKEKKEREDLEKLSDMNRLKEKLEEMIQANSKMSYDIKKNDISLSHMTKNFEGRKAFLNTIELDINRAESYGK